MLLLADSGSTKCDWALEIAGEKKYVRTVGLNPNICSKEEFLKALSSENILSEYKARVTEVRFYGAGCINENNQRLVQSWLQEFFSSVKKVFVSSDLVATQIALLGEKPGIIGILGTGSNLGYYDGKNTHFPIKSLGYILGDQGSGNAIGKALLKDYFYGDMPEEYASKLTWQNDVELHLQSDRPNAFLASKVLEFQDFFSSKYFQELLDKELSTFIEFHKSTIDQYGGELNFVGTIAFEFKENLKNILGQYGYELGRVIKSPIKFL